MIEWLKAGMDKSKLKIKAQDYWNKEPYYA